MTKSSALDLAYKITMYWARRDRDVDTRVEALTLARDETIYVVRSDMVGGLPPQQRAA